MYYCDYNYNCMDLFLSGTITIASGQDIVASLYEIDVTVTDAGTNLGPLSTSVTCYVTATVVNEHDPDFTGAPTTVPKSELTAIGM